MGARTEPLYTGIGRLIFPLPRSTAKRRVRKKSSFSVPNLKKKEVFHYWFHLQSLLWGVRPTSCDIKIEEIAVKDGLHHARHHGDLVEEAFCVITPHPVCDVESAVQAEEEQVVCGDGLRLPGFGDHEELRHYGHGLQEDGEGPQDLGGTTRKEGVKPSRAGGDTRKLTTKLLLNTD